MSKGKRSSAPAPRPKAWHYVDALGRALEQAVAAKGGAHVPLKDGDLIVTVESLRQLGRALREIAHGADPRAAFPTASKPEQSRSAAQFRFARSLIYWRSRALGRSVNDAADDARQHFGNLLPVPARASILRYARLDRDKVLPKLANVARIAADGTREPGPTAAQVEALRAELEKRGEGDWGD